MIHTSIVCPLSQLVSVCRHVFFIVNYLCSVRKILFLEPMEGYYMKDGFPPENERRFGLIDVKIQ